MRKFQDTFETRKQSFISAFSICITVPLNAAKLNLRADYQQNKLSPINASSQSS